MSQQPQPQSSPVLAVPSRKDCDVALVGDVDTVTCAEVVALLVEAVDRSSSDVVLVDVSGVTFLDSSGLGALVAARNHATGSGKRIVLVEVPPRVLTVLNITGLDQVFLA